MFGALNVVAGLDSKSDNLRPAQSALVVSFPITLKVLRTSGGFSPSELGEVARNLIRAIPAGQALNKLDLIHRLLKGFVGEEKGPDHSPATCCPLSSAPPEAATLLPSAAWAARPY
jgi:hypothetical protein